MEAELWRQQAKVSKKTRVSVPLPPLNVGHKKPRGEELSKCQLRLSFSIWHTHRHTDTTQTHRHRHTHLSQSYTLPNCSCTSGPIISLCAHTWSTHTRAHTHTHTHTLRKCSYLYSCDLELAFSGRQRYINCMNIHSLVRVASFTSPLFSCKCDCTDTWTHTHTHTHTHTFLTLWWCIPKQC